MPIIRKCIQCGKEFKTFPSCIIHRGAKYCSKKCVTDSKERNEKVSKGKLGSKNPNWKGGKIKDSCGYILIKIPKHPYANKRGYVPEHRLVCEKILGRYLTKEETVHHIGERNDNRPKMLIVFTSHKKHILFHKRPSYIKPKDIVFDGRTY